MNGSWQILEFLPVGTCIVESDFTVLSWNVCIEKWTGVKKEDIVGTSLTEHFPDVASEAVAGRVRNVFAGGPPEVFSSQIHHFLFPSPLPDGSSRIQQTTVMPLESVDGTIYALFVCEDVTNLVNEVGAFRNMRNQLMVELEERKKAEMALSAANEDLLAYICEAAFRLKEPTGLIRENLADILEQLKGDDWTLSEIQMQLRMQIKNTGEIEKNLKELTEAIFFGKKEIPEAYRSLIT